MKIHVNMQKKSDSFQIIIMILDTEDKTLTNKLFRSPLDYPSNKDYVYTEDTNNCDYIENIFISEEQAKGWAEKEVECLKNKFCI